ncbi:MAG TPA: hypothetical protein VN667_22255 [Burkholderiales bacterium]|nr:hypothetical protein [Burkholderiales bacterium]
MPDVLDLQPQQNPAQPQRAIAPGDGLPPAIPGQLKKGDRGEEVAAMQRALGIADDGVYGPETQHAVDLYQCAAPGGDSLGCLSRRYEAKDVSSVSSGTMGDGEPDRGGVSYGQYQLSSKDGMPAFLASPEGAPYAKGFADPTTGKPLMPGTLDFTRRYLEAAKSDPTGFAKAQKDFMVRSHYQPVADYAASLGFSTADRGVQEALFSQSVQSRNTGNKIIMNNALRDNPNLPQMTPEDQVQALYRARAEYVKPFVSNSAGAGRYASEMPDAVRISRYYQAFHR